jgi:hypothetical protein
MRRWPMSVRPLDAVKNCLTLARFSHIIGLFYDCQTCSCMRLRAGS